MLNITTSGLVHQRVALLIVSTSRVTFINAPLTSSHDLQHSAILLPPGINQVLVSVATNVVNVTEMDIPYVLARLQQFPPDLATCVKHLMVGLVLPIPPEIDVDLSEVWDSPRPPHPGFSGE